ncbi:hypothetical protein FHS59_004002 [Algoriphagus iocasae]|uniref:SCP domain-containing protein n=1 Tax=Algoriphagus iocasae TaxID=1836499 RepID=A0A841MRR1_9BACT|nr:CAP domain-containing protein [Algoriphagus iocasae]MBB6328359.1 hypothetical protein [Algoriphagus iocasae]
MKTMILVFVSLCVIQLPLLAQESSSSTIFNPAKILEAHNLLRQEVGVPALEWSEELAEKAQKWAEKLALKNQGEEWYLEHSGSGENLAGGFVTGDLPEVRVSDGWGSEKEDFDFSAKSCLAIEKCGHYSQIIWRNTTKVGCGLKANENGKYILVCNYDPPGNVRGQTAF